MPLQLIDTHCHLTDRRLAGKIEEVKARAQAAGVVAAITATSSLPDSAAAVELARREPWVRCTVGIHPHESAAAPADLAGPMEELIRRNCGAGILPAREPQEEDAGKMPAPQNRPVVAVGEIGLDYHYNFSPPEAQRRVFAAQLEVARRVGLPVVIHTREAFDDTLAILADSGFRGGRVVFHSFTEGEAQAGRAVALGAMVSFSGIVTFKKTDALRLASLVVPDDRLLVETDAPYLSPEPVRAMKTNEPANVAHVLACLAAVRNCPPEALAATTTANAVAFFGLSLASGADLAQQVPQHLP